MAHSRYRSSGRSLSGAPNAFLMNGVNVDPEMTPDQEARVRDLQAREIQQRGMARSRVEELRAKANGKAKALRQIDADAASARAALSVEKRPDARAQLQQRLKDRQRERAQTVTEIDQLRNQAKGITGDLQKALMRLQAQNRVEMERIKNGKAPVPETKKLDLGAVARAFGISGEMLGRARDSQVEAMSFAGVTFEGIGELPTDNLTPKDIPYYLEQEEAEFSSAIDKLKDDFAITELKRREAIELYNNTGDAQLKMDIEAREPRFQAMKREIYQLRMVGNTASEIRTASTPGRSMPVNRPAPDRYPPGYIQAGHGNPPPLHSKEGRPVYPLKDKKLGFYVPRLKELIADSNKLSREYENIRPTMGKPRGFDEMNANEDYTADKLPTAFDQYTIPPDSGRPPLPGKGVLIPMTSSEQDTTLSGLSLRSSADLGTPGHRLIGEIGDSIREVIGDLEEMQVEKKVHKPLLKSAQEILDEQLKLMRAFKEAN